MELHICQSVYNSRTPKDKPYKTEWKEFQFPVRLQSSSFFKHYRATLFENLTLKTIKIKYLLGRRKRQIIYVEVMPEFPMVILLAEKGCCAFVQQYNADGSLGQSVI